MMIVNKTYQRFLPMTESPDCVDGKTLRTRTCLLIGAQHGSRGLAIAMFSEASGTLQTTCEQWVGFVLGPLRFTSELPALPVSDIVTLKDSSHAVYPLPFARG